jgi:hypothetical protein
MSLSAGGETRSASSQYSVCRGARHNGRTRHPEPAQCKLINSIGFSLKVRASLLAEKLIRSSKKCQGTTLQLAEKIIWSCDKRQGMTSVVP